MRKSSWIALASLFVCGLWGTEQVQAQTITENFDNVGTAFVSGGWDSRQRSNPVGTTTWFQGDDVNYFDAFSGATNSYIAADYNSTTGGTGVISLWLFSPATIMNNGDTIRFYTRRTGSPFDDNLQVRINPTGGGTSTNVGATATTVGDYSRLLLDINPTLNGSYPGVWTEYVVLVSGLTGPTSARVAFRYNVPADAGPSGDESDYIGIDDFSFTPTTTGAVADVLAESFTAEYSMIPRHLVSAMPLATVVRNIGSADATAVNMEVNVYSSANNFATPIQTTTSNTIANLPAASPGGLNAGTFTPTDTGVYVIEYIVASSNDADLTNNTLVYPFEVTDSIMARDAAAFENINGNTLGLADNTQPLKLGSVYAIDAVSDILAVTALVSDIEVGDTLWAVVHNVSGGTVSASGLYTSPAYVVQASDTVGFGPGVALLRIPFASNLTLIPGNNYFVGIEKATTNTALYVFRSDNIYTAATNFFNLNNGAFNSADAIIQDALYIRPHIWINCTVNSSTSATDAICTAANGEVTANVTGGIAPFTYTWNTGATTATATGLVADTYTVTVVDANGCESTSSALVETNNINIFPTGSSTASDCGAATGSITISSVSNATLPVTYNWSTGATTSSLTGLAPGVYEGTITDANGCVISFDEIIGTTSGPTVTAGQNQAPLCPGTSDGALGFTVSGGTAPYTYEWSNAATTDNITGLAAGTYSASITDAAGCVSIFGPVTLNDPSGVSITGTTTNAGCTTADGTVTTTVTGGTTPYSYNWSNGATTANLPGVVVGSYTVTVTDANGCTQTSSTFDVVSITSDLRANLSAPVNESCPGANDGSLGVFPDDGVFPYTYLWSNGSTSFEVLNLAPGTYAVTVTDAAGCELVLDNILVAAGDAPSITLAATDATAQGASDGSIATTVTGGATPYSFAWSNGANTQDLSGLTPGTYELTVTDANGCSSVESVLVRDPLSLNNIPGLLSVELFPNPTNGQFSISLKLDQSQDVSMQLFNLTGQLLISQEFELVQEVVLPVSIEDFPAGMYYVRLRIGSEFITQKVIRR